MHLSCYIRPMSSTPKRTLIQVRVTPEEKEYVENAAKFEGMTVSDYARRQLFAPPGVTGTFVTGTPNAVASGGAMRVTSNSGLYASASHVAAVEERLTSLEQAIAQGTSALKKKT